MLFRKEFLERIRAGVVTLAFRRWRRPSVRAGSTLLTPVGQLSIQSVEPVSSSRISVEDARRAGYESRESLLDELQRRPEGEIYRVKLGPLLPDPRIVLRETPADADAELQALRSRLSRLDSRAPDGAWSFRTLEALRSHPGVRAGDVCCLVGQEKERFKLNVRKLKNLGLTESLGTGYRSSPRGESLLHVLRLEAPGNATEQPVAAAGSLRSRKGDRQHCSA